MRLRARGSSSSRTFVGEQMRATLSSRALLITHRARLSVGTAVPNSGGEESKVMVEVAS
jgi:hypothetical protein